MIVRKGGKMDISKIVGTDFQGCISVRQGGYSIFQAAYGYADLPNQVPNTLDTKFPTASAGKVFVAVGILQLIEKGKLRFEDTIGRLLDFDLHKIDPEITIEQLLTHTSGIPDYFDESVMEEYAELWRDYPNYKIRTSSDLLPLFLDKPMMYPKGERFQYNNTGYVVLGLIIEKVAGMPFDTYLKENVFIPAGMRETGYYELDRLSPKCANAYIFDCQRNEYYTNIYSVDAKGTGAGGAYTTVGDIERFWEALLGNKFLSASMTARMLSRKSGSAEDGYYGYGVWLKHSGEGICQPYFQGCDPGVSFITAYQPEDEMFVTIVSNFGNNVWRMLREIRQGLFVK